MHTEVFINKHMNCRYEAVDQQVAGVNERMNPCVQTQERRNQTKQKNLCGVRRKARRTDRLQPDALI